MPHSVNLEGSAKRWRISSLKVGTIIASKWFQVPLNMNEGIRNSCVIADILMINMTIS